MLKFEPTEYVKQRPSIQMMSMIDIMFINLLFFMALFVYFHFEAELNISVPKASASMESQFAPEQIIVNIAKDGTIIVNQQQMSAEELSEMLHKATKLYPGQPVIVRADQKTYHEDVVRVLDLCAKSKIWNISFATVKEK